MFASKFLSYEERMGTGTANSGVIFGELMLSSLTQKSFDGGLGESYLSFCQSRCLVNSDLAGTQ